MGTLMTGSRHEQVLVEAGGGTGGLMALRFLLHTLEFSQMKPTREDV